ncbi:MAG: hypothetical protein ACI8XC_004091 [Gammaproteobacteria bacterium]|jgi:hypothetical protein
MVNMHWVTVSLFILIPTSAFAWFQESGNGVSAVVTYDTTDQQALMISYHRLENCGFAGLWLDQTLYDSNYSDASRNLAAIVRIDNYDSWPISFEIQKSELWLPNGIALRQNITSELVSQIRKGKELKIFIGPRKLSWNLKGSSRAIKLAYNGCIAN